MQCQVFCTQFRILGKRLDAHQHTRPFIPHRALPFAWTKYPG
jgi:hypothetical protein